MNVIIQKIKQFSVTKIKITTF